MTKEEILEGNKLIAEFLGYVYVPYTAGHSGRPCGWVIKNYKLVDRKVPKLFLGRTTKDLLYHKSWDWLMPVVEKIENTKPFYSVSNNAGFWYNDETYTVDRNKPQYLCIISDKSCRIVINSANYFLERNNKLVATWFAVVEFIKWYNLCQK